MAPKRWQLSSSLMMMMIILSLVLVSGVVGLPGGWKPIPDLKAEEVQEAAKFAVKEHNIEAKTQLVFQSLKSGDQHIVSGINYRLVITAKDNNTALADYQAIVWYQPWTHLKQLQYFTKL